MKILSACSLALYLLMLAGCEKSSGIRSVETVVDQSGAKSANAVTETRPMKVSIIALADSTLPPVQCLPDTYGALYVGGGGNVQGEVNYVGRINSAQSPFLVTGCFIGPAENQVTQLISGTITAANGENFHYTGNATVTLTDATLKGIINIDGGTGKFTGATGAVNITGTVDFQTGVAQWNGEGSITF